MNIAILGFGREGKSVLSHLARTERVPRKNIFVLDRNQNIKVPRGVRKISGPNYLKNLDRFDVIYRSPGIRYALLEIQKARRAGAKISSATKLFFELCPATIIGVTGTKGKGTTSTLIYKMLRRSKRDAHLAGNIGKPALKILPKLKKSSIVVLELSSFQLQDLTRSPHIAVVLDVFPDHQDVHRNLKEYYEAKANIVKHQLEKNKTFFFARNKEGRRIASQGRGRKIAVDEKRFKIFSKQDLKMVGAHNFKNAAMAATVARNMGVSERAITSVAKSFHGLKHRMEFLCKIGGVRYCNDSAAVNPGAAVAALNALGKNIVLIAGGKERCLDYSGLARAIQKKTRAAVLFGENKRVIQRAICKTRGGKRVIVKLVKDVNEAVRVARRLARPNDTVLLSPASASFDMFRNYGERGEKFAELVRSLKRAQK